MGSEMLHVGLLLLVALAPCAVIALSPGVAHRQWREFRMPLVVFSLIILLCGLVLSATGIPLIEWALPFVAFLMIGLFCKSNHVFVAAKWIMPIVALFLCANFLTLVHQDFTAVPRLTKLQREGKVPSVTFEPRWHTPVTRLYRVSEHSEIIER